MDSFVELRESGCGMIDGLYDIPSLEKELINLGTVNKGFETSIITFEVTSGTSTCQTPFEAW